MATWSKSAIPLAEPFPAGEPFTVICRLSRRKPLAGASAPLAVSSGRASPRPAVR